LLESKSVQRFQLFQSVTFELDIVIGIEIVDPHNLVTELQAPRGNVITDKSSDASDECSWHFLLYCKRMAERYRSFLETSNSLG
jgi:hypothetical protein